MITRFPSNLQTSPEKTSLNEASTPIGPIVEPWIRWIFQSARIEGDGLMFRSQARSRSQRILDWQHFINHCFLPILAPSILRVHLCDYTKLGNVIDAELQHLKTQLSYEQNQRSCEIGETLLHNTEGAKYQAALGQFRQQVEAQQKQAQLPIVWALIGQLFQLPSLDLLQSLLQEEWLSNAHQQALPLGNYSIPAIATQALHLIQKESPFFHKSENNNYL